MCLFFFADEPRKFIIDRKTNIVKCLYLCIPTPQTTLLELRKVFPNELNSDKCTKEIFILDKKGTDANWDGYFKVEELLTMGDGKKVSVVKMWPKPSLERIVNQAKLFNIEVQSVEVWDLENKKKGFNLEYLNGYILKEDISLSQDSNFLSRFLPLIKSLFSK